MVRLALIISIFIANAALIGCIDNSAKNQQKLLRINRPAVGEFKAKIYPVNDSEHITMFDVPGKYEPTRCWVWVDQNSKTSHMQCDNEAAGALPESGLILDR